MEKLHIRIEDHTATVVRNALRDAIGLDTNQYRDCTDADKILWASSLNHHAQALHAFECAYQVAKKEREEAIAAAVEAAANELAAEQAVLDAVASPSREELAAPLPVFYKQKPKRKRRVK